MWGLECQLTLQFVAGVGAAWLPLAGDWGSSLPRKPIVSGAALHEIRKPGGDLQADFRNLRIIPQAQVCNQLLQQWGENALWRKTAFFKLLNAS